MKSTKLAVILVMSLCVMGCSNQNTGTLVGATSGALIGGPMGVAAVGVGLGVGAIVGVGVGTIFDHCAPTKPTLDTPTKHG